MLAGVYGSGGPINETPGDTILAMENQARLVGCQSRFVSGFARGGESL